MVAIPQSTVEKPLTPIDYIAVLTDCGDLKTLCGFASMLPEAVVADDRFARAFKIRLDELRHR